MVLPAAIALMTYGAYRSHKRDEREAAQEDEDRKDRQEDRAFRKSERDRVVATRAKMAEAAAPVAVVDGTTYQPEVDDDGNQMPANPTAGTYKVAGQRFTDKTTADAAATTANTPAARTARMSAVMDASGDVVGAQSLRTGARQEAVADLQLTAAQQAADDERKFREFVSPIARKSWPGVKEAYALYGDGDSAEAIPDGKGGATVVSYGPDGKENGRKAYKSELEFVQSIRGTFDPKLWIGQQEKAAETARLQGNWQKEYELRETKAKSRDELRAAKAEAAGLRARMAGGGSGSGKGGAEPEGAVGGIPMKDIQANLNRAGDIIRKDLKIGGDPSATTDPATLAAEKAAIEAADRLTTQTQRLIMGAAQVGVPLTAEMAIEAARTGKVRMQQIRNPDTGELANVQVMEVGGRLIPLALTAPTPEKVGGGRGSVTPQRMDQPAPAPAPRAAMQPPAAAEPARNQYVDRTGRALPSAPSGEPAAISKVLPAVGRAVDAVESAANRQAVTYLQGKIQRGEPLSSSEQVRASQFGLLRQ